ncbi:MAG: VOC family protein [Actinomycetota bacterium]|nr:VOC family protein [Actinomycetota bacterium]
MGSVVHFEIPADDVSRAQHFYRQAFGWEVSEMPGMGYTILSTTKTDERGMPTTPGAINGGLAKRADPLTAPIITIDVEDIDQALQHVESLGGSIVQGRQDVGGMGFTAYFRDTEGNTMGMWQNA